VTGRWGVVHPACSFIPMAQEPRGAAGRRSPRLKTDRRPRGRAPRSACWCLRPCGIALHSARCCGRARQTSTSICPFKHPGCVRCGRLSEFGRAGFPPTTLQSSCAPTAAHFPSRLPTFCRASSSSASSDSTRLATAAGRCDARPPPPARRSRAAATTSGLKPRPSATASALELPARPQNSLQPYAACHREP
jgi:hypothetical protein